MTLPKIDDANRKKPLCYDAARRKFIYFDDIVSGREPIVSIDSLSPGDLRKLVIERNRAGPDYNVQAISGPPYSRNDVIKAIKEDTPFGRKSVEVDANYLRELLDQIRRALKPD